MIFVLGLFLLVSIGLCVPASSLPPLQRPIDFCRQTYCYDHGQCTGDPSSPTGCICDSKSFLGERCSNQLIDFPYAVIAILCAIFSAVRTAHQPHPCPSTRTLLLLPHRRSVSSPWLSRSSSSRTPATTSPRTRPAPTPPSYRSELPRVHHETAGPLLAGPLGLPIRAPSLAGAATEQCPTCPRPAALPPPSPPRAPLRPPARAPRRRSLPPRTRLPPSPSLCCAYPEARSLPPRRPTTGPSRPRDRPVATGRSPGASQRAASQMTSARRIAPTPVAPPPSPHRAPGLPPPSAGERILTLWPPYGPGPLAWGTGGTPGRGMLSRGPLSVQSPS